jgi:hypothetical protein
MKQWRKDRKKEREDTTEYPPTQEKKPTYLWWMLNSGLKEEFTEDNCGGLLAGQPPFLEFQHATPESAPPGHLIVASFKWKFL